MLVVSLEIWSGCADEFGEINQLPRDEVECNLEFAGFLVFHCPLKPDAVETLKMLADSSHRVGQWKVDPC